jgi:glutamyl-tRNA synthetase
VEFREKGYLPEAILNYIALLGWSYDASTEVFSLSELERLFSLERLNKAPAVFDYRKLDWFNGLYIRKLPAGRLAELLLPFLQQQRLVADPPAGPELERVRAMVPLVRERLALLSDVGKLVRFLFRPVAPAVEDLVPRKLERAAAAEALRRAERLLEGFAERSDADNEARFRALAAELGLKLGDLLMPVRVAVTGSRASPPLFESLRLLGEEESRRRLRAALELLA